MMGQSLPGTSTSNTIQNNMHMTTVHGVCQIYPERHYSPDFFFKMAHDKVSESAVMDFGEAISWD